MSHASVSLFGQSLRRKLFVAILLISVMSMLVLAISASYRQHQDGLQLIEREINILAELIGNRSKAALEFGDQRLAEQNLGLLSIEQAIVKACLYDAEHKIFARYHGNAFSCEDHSKPVPNYQEGLIKVLYDIEDGSGHQGSIHILADTTLIDEQQQSFILYLMVSISLILILAGLMSFYMQRLIFTPIMRLKETANAIARDSRYSMRVEKVTADEIGQLTDTFNNMLDTIEDQNNTLLRVNNRLEEAVVERTAELEEETKKHREVSEALKQEQKLFFAGSIVVWKWRAESTWPVEYVSPNVAYQFGYTAEDFTTGRIPFAEIVHPDDLQRVADEVSNYVAQGMDNFEQEYRLRDSMGNYRWLYDYTVIVRGKDKQPTHFHGYVFDITERKLLEEQQRNNEYRLEQSQAIAHVGTWDWNIVTGELIWSDEIFRIFGYEPQSVEVSYDRFIQHVHHDDVEALTSEVQNSLENPNHRYNIEHRIVVNNGEVRVVLEQGVVYRDENGEPVRMIGVVHDITQQKEHDRLKNEFVSTVNHELRTPLTSIRGSLGLINGGAMGEVSEEMAKLIGIAYENADRLLHLINDLLDMEKIASGKLQFEMTNIAVKELIEKSLIHNAAYSEQHGVTYQSHLPEKDYMLYLDEQRFLQVMANLLSNAAKFSKQGDNIDIRITDMDQEICIAVQDYGRGIPKEFHDRIFTKFSQADSSDSRQLGGTGLGLNIAKALVEHMDGHIRFESEEGEGTTFFICFPKHQLN